MENNINTSKRLYGIDLLRMLLMYLVVVLHVLLRGGILEQVEFGTGQYISAWLLEIVAYCAVDCFALISGFVSWNRKYNFKKILPLWLQVALYSVGITLLFSCILPESKDMGILAKSFFPITTTEYWYMSAYAGMFFFIPLLNLIIEKADFKILKNFFIAVVILMCLLPCLLQQDTYGLTVGYSTIWLIIMYLLGGFINKYNLYLKLSKAKCVITFVISTAFVLTFKLGIGFLVANIVELPLGENTFVSYVSPFIILNAITLLCLFAQLDFKNTIIIKLIKFFSPAALGVYLIHTHPMVWIYVLNYRFASYAYDAPILLVLKVVGTAAIIYASATLIDLIRIGIFKLLKIK